MRKPDPLEKLPPHSPEAERGIIGCCLLDAKCVPEAAERFQGERVFFDLRHQEIFSTMLDLHREGIPLDPISLLQRLKDQRRLDEVGGGNYILESQDTVPTAANLGYYIELVWEKYLARCLLQQSGDVAEAVRSINGVNEVLISRTKRLFDEWEQKVQRGSPTPKFLKNAGAFDEGFFAQFFGADQEEPGVDLPIRFKLKIRRRETTLVTGDDGSGKSTLLSYFGLHLAAAGEKICIASMEMPPAVTLWILASQILGRKRIDDTEAGRASVIHALAWLNQKVMFYDFLGIADWHDVLDTFRYAAQKHACTTFILDSVMRIGIPDDDYAQQGLAAAAFAQFAKENDAHLFFVIHENKGDGRGKAKIRGSKLWSANADNVIRVERNDQKGEKESKLRHNIAVERAEAPPDYNEISRLEKDLERLRREWDTHIVLQKQRYPGTQQNAAKYVWFDRENFQFREHVEDAGICWLNRWRAQQRPKENFPAKPVGTEVPTP